MTTTPAALQAAAFDIRNARADRKTIPGLASTHGIHTVADAYAVAEINTRARLAEPGRRIVGLKVGLTSLAVQRQLGVDQPDFGVLFDDMEFLDGDAVPAHRLIQPKVEAEIAFVVTRSLSSTTPSWAEFIAAIGYALPALEIVDSVIADWKITLADTIADNASSALYVLGNQPVALGSPHLPDVGMQLSIGGQTASVGSGAACLGNPLRAAYWLAKTMAMRGQPLAEGQVILSGALGPMVPIQAGDLVSAQLGGLGSVSCRMV